MKEKKPHCYSEKRRDSRELTTDSVIRVPANMTIQLRSGDPQRVGNTYHIRYELSNASGSSSQFEDSISYSWDGTSCQIHVQVNNPDGTTNSNNISNSDDLDQY